MGTQTQSDAETLKELQSMRSKYGRINQSEYEKLTGTPVQKNPAPVTAESKQMKRQRKIQGRLGRVNTSEYKRLTEKHQPRKRTINKGSR